MSTLPIRTRRWTRREYDRLVELGVLHEDEPIELVDGEMVVREPKHTPHTTATELTAEALRLAFGRGWHARVQEPVALEDDSEPEPDVAVVRGAPREYLASIPRGRRSSSKSRNRASRSIVGGRAGFMRGQISRTTDRQPGGSCPRGLSPAGPRGVSPLRLEVPQRTGAEARGERLAARRPDRTDRRRRSAAVGRASPQAPLNPRAAARRPNVRETMMRVAELWRYPVKSLAGERLERAELTVEGIAGDRVVHVRDARGRVITSRTHPKLLGLRATLGPDGEPRIGGRPGAAGGSAAAGREAGRPPPRPPRHHGRGRVALLPRPLAPHRPIP